MGPPQLPPKDYNSSSTTSFLSPNNSNSRISSNSRSSLRSNNNNFVDQDLAEAVRDSVQINTPKPIYNNPTSRTSILLDTTSTNNNGILNNNNNNHRQPPLPSLNPLIPRRTPSPNVPNISQDNKMNTTSPSSSSYQPTHNYSQSSPDMSLIMSNLPQQPSLPSARMNQLAPKNPFEDDEIEPSGQGRIKPPGSGHTQQNKSFGGGTSLESDGLIQHNRAKFNRSQTGSAAAGSSSSHLLGPTSPTNGSGSGKTRTRRSMSSDSYGFNSEMPVIRELTAGQKKAADDKKGSRHADVIDTWDPTGLGSAMWHHAGPYDAAAPSRNQNLPGNKAPMKAFRAPPVQSPPPKGPTTISLSSPPVVPAKDLPGEVPEKPAHRRGPSANRIGAPPSNRRVSGGGLTGQYSTSMPSSGGYFPNMDEPTDEAAIARMERQKEREAKRRALKAAWGVDTPEPFEDFGGSPVDGTVDLATDNYSPEAFSAPLPGKSARSPGIRFGAAANSPPVKEEAYSPTGENPPAITRAAGPGGVKRTKSLMQKIKTMRENPSLATRSSSPKAYSPTESGLNSSSSTENALESKRPGFFSRGSGSNSGGRNSPSKKLAPPIPTNLSNSNVPTIQSNNNNNTDNAIFQDSSNNATTQRNGNLAEELDEPEDDEEELEKMVPSGAGSGFVLVESPSSKVRALRALQKEREHSHGHHNRSYSNNDGVSSVPANRTKYLPTPPVAPVMPDFDDLLSPHPPPRRNSPLEVPTEEGGLKRKTSMVKKLKDRMVK
ncbi:uncharacterized protein L201_004828 [Kwoniella dendrophila CBS 6074]|uniref:Pal1 cell morphology protein n=1 Tax=Kwoniella dendrophila CBS 6074 TaxID=1295534 RepID=A0AAX4JYD2_9TREE